MLPIRLSGLIGLAVLIAGVSPALAQSCKDRFVKAATEGNGEGQYRQIVTQSIKGAPSETVNEFIMNGRDHWVSKAVEPKGSGWTLMYDGVMYSSLDEGASWKEVTKFDEAAAAAARAQQKRDAEGVTELDCGTEEVDGKTLDRVHGQYEVTVGFKSTQVHTYWIAPETGLIVRSHYKTISPSFESTVLQKMIPFGDAVVPKP